MSRHNVGVPGTYQPTNLTYPPPSHSLPPILTCQGLFVILITAIHCTPHPHTATHTPSPIGPPNYTATHTQPTTAMLPPAWSTRESTSRAACGCNTTSAHHPSIHPRKPLRPPPTLPGCEPAPALFPPTSPHRGKRIPTGGGDVASPRQVTGPAGPQYGYVRILVLRVSGSAQDTQTWETAPPTPHTSSALGRLSNIYLRCAEQTLLSATNPDERAYFIPYITFNCNKSFFTAKQSK